MKVMKLSLRSVEYSAALSEETSAFSATVCIDGVPAFIASNHGTGGCDEHHPLKGQSYDEMRENLEKVNAYGKTREPMESHGMKLEYDVDLLVGEALDEWMLVKEAKRLYKRTKDRIVMIVNGEIRETKPVPAIRLAAAREFMLSRYPLSTNPTAFIVNDAEEEHALSRIIDVLKK